MHRRKWICPHGCAKDLPSKTAMVQHLMIEHSNIVNERQVSTYADMCERQIDDTEAETCPICLENMSLSELYGHLATHMEEIALFVLPITSDDDGGEYEDPQLHPDGRRGPNATTEIQPTLASGHLQPIYVQSDHYRKLHDSYEHTAIDYVNRARRRSEERVIQQTDDSPLPRASAVYNDYKLSSFNSILPQDPVSFLAAEIGIADVAFRVLKYLKDVKKATNTTDADISAFIDEVSNLTTLYGELEKKFLDSVRRKVLADDEKMLWSRAGRTLETGQDLVRRLEDSVKDIYGDSRTIAGKWNGSRVQARKRSKNSALSELRGQIGIYHGVLQMWLLCISMYVILV
jgi:hypothetical protein